MIKKVKAIWVGQPDGSAKKYEFVKHGKWSSDIPTNSFFKYKCSVCGEGQDIKTRFCSGCGAKMDGE